MIINNEAGLTLYLGVDNLPIIPISKVQNVIIKHSISILRLKHNKMIKRNKLTKIVKHKT
jgi:hypothetical protein